MEGPCLFLLIICLLAGSVSCYEARCLSSRCQWNNVHFLNCRSTGITTLGDLFFLDQETRNVTSSNHLQRCLRSTKDIDLSYNLMSALYLNVFYKFASLETLNITNNQIYRVSLNKNGKQQEKGAFPTSLQTLVLNGNRLIAIPKGLCKLKSLQTLSLSANRILYIQRDDFANCSELQHVDLGENRISNIHPEAFQDLRNLQVLKLHRNTLVSLSPLVFLFKHVLKADIDLSDNLWACDCSLQPLKYLISSLSTSVWKPWNVTCSTPFSKAGQHILSIENRQSCQTSDYSFAYDKTLLITVGEEASLDCGSSNQLRNTDVLWWTPRGIISKEKQNGNYYLSDTNSLILDQPDYSDEGLYLCLTNAPRTAYQVGIQVNNLKTKRRSPRDLQLKNARMQTQSSFNLAVSLSVILTFLVAFCLGVFIRPYLESLWRKGCKSKDTETQHSDAVYENEGFTADYTTRKYSENRNVSSLSQHETRQTFEKPDGYNLEAEIIIGTQERAIDVENPTYNAVEEMREDMNTLPQRLPKTKRVKWAINEDLDFNVNLKYYMSLLKPINFIVLDSSMPAMVHAHQSHSTNSGNSDISVHKHNKDITEMLGDSCSSDEGSSFSLDSEYDISDDDSIIHAVLQETKQETQDDNASLRINLKHVISLLKPVHIIVPDSTVPTIVKSTRQKQLFPLGISAYPENRMENVDNSFQNLQGSKVAEGPHENHSLGRVNKHKKNEKASKSLYDTSSCDESSIHSFDSEYELSDQDELLNFSILGKSKKLSNENGSFTVNLKFVMSLLKPINIIVPEPTTVTYSEPQLLNTSRIHHTVALNDSSTSDISSNEHNKDKSLPVEQSECQLQSADLTNQYAHPKKAIEVTQPLYDSSSSEDNSNDSEDSDKPVIGNPILNTLLPGKWGSNENLYPIVNLRQVISTLKPIKIKVPDVINYSATISPKELPLSPNEDFKVTSQKLYYYSSSDEHSNYSDHDSSDEFENRSSTLPVPPPPRKRAGSEKAYTSVNLKHIISSLKPIHFHMPGSTHYTDTLITPKKDTEVTQNLYDFSSSESSNDSADSEHESSFEEIIMSPIVSEPVPKEWKTPALFAPTATAVSSSDPTVNLKQVISSFKPIYIISPDTTVKRGTPLNKDTDVAQKLYDFSFSDTTESGRSSESADSEHEGSDEDIIMSPNVFEPKPTEWKTPLLAVTATEWASSEDLTPTINIKQLISSFKPIHINIPDTTFNSDIPVKKDTDVAQKLYDFSSDITESGSSSESADSEHEGSDEEIIQSNYSPELKTGWKNDDYPTSTVNLKHIISSLKPINFDIPGTPHYTDTIVTPNKDTELLQNPYDFRSSGSSNDSDHDSSDEFVNRDSTLPVPPPRKRAGSEKFYTTVNLKHLISSIKPFPIHMPGSTHYTDTLLIPKKDTEVTQNPYEFSSSESSNDSGDSEHKSSFEEIIMSPNVSKQMPTEWKTPASFAPTATAWASSEDLTPTVNLKQVISLFKPILINSPDTTFNSDIPVKKDADVAQTLYDFSFSDATESGSSSETADSEHEGSDEEVIQSNYSPELKTEWENHDYPTSTVNLKHIIASIKPFHINIPGSPHYTDTLVTPNKDTEVTQNPYEFNSSESSNDSDHDSSDEFVKRSSTLPVPPPRKRADSKKVYTNVNLKHIISTLKPIKIHMPGSTHHTHTLVTPKMDTEVTQNPYDFSSSEGSNDSDHDSSDEFVERSSTLPVPPPRKRAGSENVYTSVNLKHIISGLRPIQIHMPGSAHYTDTLITPKKDTEVTQNLYDFSSSESSNDSADSEHESSFEEIIMSPIVSEPVPTEWKTPALFAPTATAGASSEDLTPTVNLKQVISSFKPIYIISPDTTVKRGTPLNKDTDVAQKLYDFSFSDTTESGRSFESADSEHEGSDEEIIQSNYSPELKTEWKNHDYPTSTVNLKHIIASLKPIHIDIPGTPHYTDTLVTPEMNTEVTQNPYEFDSSETSNDSDHDSSDEFVNRSSTLPVPPPRKMAGSEKVYTSVNLKHIISTLKPIQIHMPGSTHYTDTLVNPEKDTEVTQNPYEFSSSESSNDSDHDSSDEFVNRDSTLPVPPPRKRTGSEKVYTSVNLKHILSTLKPIPIHMPGSTHYTDILVTPKKDTEITQNAYEFSSSESSNDSADSEHESSYGEIIMSPNVSEQMPTEWKTPTLFAPTAKEWASNEDLTPTVNLKQVISLFKPILINSPDTTFNSDILVKKDTDVAQKLYDFTYSDTTESGSSSESADSEHEGSDEDVIQRINSPEQKTEWKNHDYPTSTVNLKHLISSIKPFHINIPGSPHYTDTLVTPNKDTEVTQNPYEFNSSESSNDSDHDSSDEFVKRSSTLPVPPPRKRADSRKVYTNVNLKHIISTLKPIKIHMPGSTHHTHTLVTPKMDTEVTQNPYDFSSSEGSNDSDHDSSDEFVERSSTLPVPPPRKRAGSENVYTSVNLKHIISGLRPIHIHMPGSTHYKDTLITAKKYTEFTQNPSEFSSSESSNDSADSEHECSYEEIKMSPNVSESVPTERKTPALLAPTRTEWESNENLTPTVNLQQLISLFKPIRINIPDTTVNSHIPVKKDTDVAQKLYDFTYSDTTESGSSTESADSENESSNDSFDLNHEDSNKEVIKGISLPELAAAKGATNENLAPIVNLKHIISSFKPIHIKVPDSTHYSDTIVNPRKNIEVTTQKLPDYGSSVESPNYLVDSDHESSDEDIERINIPKCIPTTQASNENISSTVNLRCIISTFKPINITVADSTKYSDTLASLNTDTEVMQKQYGNILSGTIPNYLNNSTSEDSEDITILNLPKPVLNASNEKDYPTVNFKNVIKPLHMILQDSPNNSDSFIIPIKTVEVSKKPHNGSSSDDSSAESAHEGSYEVTNQRMHIKSSTDEDSSASNSSEVEDSHKGILLVKHSTLPKPTPTEWARNENLSPTVNFRHIISLLKPIKFEVQSSAHHSDPLKIPKKNIEVTQEKYDYNSHDDTSADSEHEDPDIYVTKSSFLHNLTPTERAKNENSYPTLNLRQVISALKPIKIRVSESNQYEDTSMTSKKNIFVTSKTGNDINLSDKHSNYLSNSKQEGTDEYVATTEWAQNKHVNPTVNLKHVTALVKPIRIKVPDSAYDSDALRSSKKINKVTAEKHFDHSSSDDESSKGSSDLEHQNSDENMMSSKLAKPTLTEWARTEMAYPTVIPTNVTSLPKPRSIMASDSAVPEVVKRPKWKSFFSNSTSKYKENQTENIDKYQPISHSFSQPRSPEHNKNSKHRNFYTFKNPSKNTNVILTSYKTAPLNDTSYNIDDWGHKGLNKSNTTNSDLLKSKMAAQAINKDDAPEVNLKHVMSLIKPIRIIAPELQMTHIVKHPPLIHIPPQESSKRLQEKLPSSFYEKPMASRLPEQHSTVYKDLSQSDLIQFYMDSSEEDVLL